MEGAGFDQGWEFPGTFDRKRGAQSRRVTQESVAVIDGPPVLGRTERQMGKTQLCAAGAQSHRVCFTPTRFYFLKGKRKSYRKWQREHRGHRPHPQVCGVWEMKPSLLERTSRDRVAREYQVSVKTQR